MANLGTKGNPILITSAEELDAVRNQPNACYRLTTDINLAVTPFNKGKGWQPIKNFAGDFDGDGHVVKNMVINDNALESAGLFGELAKGAQVYDLGIVRASINASDKAGILAGSVIGDNVGIKRCFTNGEVNAEYRLGGIVGGIAFVNNVWIDSCHSSATLTVGAEYSGGIVGSMTAVEGKAKSGIKECYYNGKLKGGNLITVGPLYGKIENISIDGCYYDKEKNLHKCEDEGVVGLTSAEMTKKENMPAFQYTYFMDKKKWRFLEGNAPKLWHEDEERIFLHFDDAFHIFDKDSNAWKSIGSAKQSTLSEIEMGMKTLDDIPIVKFKELEKHGVVDVYCFIEDMDEGFMTKRQVLALFDVERTEQNVELKVLTKKESGDFDPAKRAIRIFADTKLTKNNEKVAISFEKEKPVEADNLSGKKNSINSKALLIESDEKHGADTKPQELSVQQVNTIAEQLPDKPYIGFSNPHRELQAYGVKHADYEGLNLEIMSEKEKLASATNLAEKAGLINEKSLVLDTDERAEAVLTDGQMSYAFSAATATRDRAMSMEMKSVTKSRYMLSVSNGSKWLTYNAETNTWAEEKLNNIHSAGITKEQMADPAIWKNFPSTYKSKIKTAVGIRTESFGSKHTITDMEINFQENQGPTVEDDNVTVLGDSVVFTGRLNDLEGDEVEYQVVTQQFGEKDWRQITPAPIGWFKRPNGYEFKHVYELSDFRSGDNTLRIFTKDARGMVYHKDYQLIIVSGEPIVKVESHNEFYAKATVDHSLGKKVRFQVLINNKQVTPRRGYTDWKVPPFDFEYSWNSDDLEYGLPNKISIIAVDELGTKTQADFTVEGGYKSLLFRDENDMYYSTDKGSILQQLDFGTVIGGQLMEPHIVYLENRTGLELENVTVYVDMAQQEPNLKLKLSEVNAPFASNDSFTYTGTMKHGDVKAFYARIEADIDTKSVKDKVFNIYAKGDPVIA